MKRIKVSPLSRDNFARYGQIIDLNDLGAASINTEVVKFWKQQVEVEQDGEIVKVTVQFKSGSEEVSGRIWWMFNRRIDGSAAYIMEHFPDENWKDMTYDKKKKLWTAEIELSENASTVDFFSTHGKILQRKSKEYHTYISSPYTRIKTKN